MVLLLEKAKERSVQIIPIDSEHNAIFQVLQNDDKCVEKIILTASGGPFLNYSLEHSKSGTKSPYLENGKENLS